MPEPDFTDSRLIEKTPLSEREILNEIKIIEYKQHLLSFINIACKKLSEVGSFSGVKYAYSPEPEQRLSSDAKGRILQLRNSVNEKLWNWNVGINSGSGDTGAAIYWLVAQGVILEHPEFTNTPEMNSIYGNPRIVSDEKLFFAEIGCFFRKDNPDSKSQVDNFEPEVVYTTLKINLDQKLINTLIEQVSQQNLYYKSQLSSIREQ